MEDSPFLVEYPSDCPNCWNDATAVSICPLGQAGQGDPISFYSPRSMTVVSMILTIEISVSLFRISHHLIGPLEEGLVFYLF